MYKKYILEQQATLAYGFDNRSTDMVFFHSEAFIVRFITISGEGTINIV